VPTTPRWRRLHANRLAIQAVVSIQRFKCSGPRLGGLL
jgi:lysylphosphatidylglycerol synthetase-like protein (DUF2156 family)